MDVHAHVGERSMYVVCMCSWTGSPGIGNLKIYVTTAQTPALLDWELKSEKPHSVYMHMHHNVLRSQLDIPRRNRFVES